MTDDKFKELVNLHLDREIAAEDELRLREELAANPARRQEFEEMRRLHRAILVALGSSLDFSGLRREPGGVVSFRRWALSLAAAACFLVGGSLALSTLEREETSGITVVDAVEAATLAEAVGPSDIRRFEASQRSNAVLSSSLTAQLRLAGLSPELVPDPGDLAPVDASTLRARADSRQRAVELFERLKSAKPIPETRLVRLPEAPASESWTLFGGGTQASLASFR